MASLRGFAFMKLNKTMSVIGGTLLSSMIIFLIYLFVYFWVLPRVLIYLPLEYAERFIRYEISSAINDREAFPREILTALLKDPELATPVLYESITHMLVYAEDGEIKDTVKLIKLINKPDLYCAIIPDYSRPADNNFMTNYAGTMIAETIDSPDLCPQSRTSNHCAQKSAKETYVNTILKR